MSNLPSVLPSQQDINEMARLRQIMNGSSNLPAQHEQQASYSGGSQGTRRPLNESQYSAPPVGPVGFAGREDVDAMRDVLQRFKAASGEADVQRINEAMQAPTPMYEAHETRASWNAATAVAQVSAPTGQHEVRISLSESADGKETKDHMVVNGAGQAVVSGLSLVESAKAVMKLLNKGLGANHARVAELSELDEDYNRNRILAGQARARYQRSMELGESAAASVFKTRFETARATALATQDQIKSILESIR